MFDVEARVALLREVETLQGVNAKLVNTAECYANALGGTVCEGLFAAAGAIQTAIQHLSDAEVRIGQKHAKREDGRV